MAKDKKIVKTVFKHLKEDEKDYIKGIKDDKKLKTQIRKIERSKEKKGS